MPVAYEQGFVADELQFVMLLLRLSSGLVYAPLTTPQKPSYSICSILAKYFSELFQLGFCLALRVLLEIDLFVVRTKFIL